MVLVLAMFSKFAHWWRIYAEQMWRISACVALFIGPHDEPWSVHLTWLRSPFPTNHSLAHMASQPISTGKHWTMDFTIIASGSLSYQFKNISDLIHGMTEVCRSWEHTASCVALPVTNGHHRDSCVASWYIVISQNQLDTIVTENDAWVSASPRSAQSLCPFCSTSPRSVQEDASTLFVSTNVKVPLYPIAVHSSW